MASQGRWRRPLKKCETARAMRLRLILTIALFSLCFTVRAETPRRTTVAVLYFDYDGHDEELGSLKKGLAQMLTTDLSTLDTLTLVERARLEDVLKEIDLGRSGKIDSATAARVGKLLGAQYLVMGRYFELKGALRIDARAIETETGKIIRSTGAHGSFDNFFALEQKLAAELGESLAKQPAGSPRSGGKLAQKTIKMSTKVAVRFSKALDAMDRQQPQEAQAQLRSVIAEQPDFELARTELTALLR